MEAVFDVDQLRGDAHRRARFAHRSLQDMVDAERVADLAQVVVLTLECKGRSPPGNLELLDRGQGIQDLLGDAVRKIFLLGIGTHVDEWQYGDRLAARRRDHLGFALDHAIGDEQDDGDGQHPDDDEIQLASRGCRDRLAAIDVFLALEALRGQLECPGKDQRRENSDREDEEDQPGCPFGQGHHRRHDVDDLQQYPRGNAIGDTDAKHVAALQFCEEPSQSFNSQALDREEYTADPRGKKRIPEAAERAFRDALAGCQKARLTK